MISSLRPLARSCFQLQRQFHISKNRFYSVAALPDLDDYLLLAGSKTEAADENLGGKTKQSDEERAKAKRELLRQGLQSGHVGFGFSAGGFLYCYHLVRCH